MTTLSTRAGAAAATLTAMRASGLDVSAADGLAGEALERWIDLALDADFDKDFAEFSAERAAELVKRKADNAG